MKATFISYIIDTRMSKKVTMMGRRNLGKLITNMKTRESLNLSKLVNLLPVLNANIYYTIDHAACKHLNKS